MYRLGFEMLMIESHGAGERTAAAHAPIRVIQ
jgi:hypothetical protein